MCDQAELIGVLGACRCPDQYAIVGLTIAWRCVDYELKSESLVRDLSLNGAGLTSIFAHFVGTDTLPSKKGPKDEHHSQAEHSGHMGCRAVRNVSLDRR